MDYDVNSFCAGGAVQLSVSEGTYNSSYTYTWYENNTQLGTGRYCLYTVPTSVSSVVIRCRATSTSGCASEAVSTKTLTVNTVPRPDIRASSTILCNGSITLTATMDGGGYTYRWYRDNELMHTGQQITVNTGGDYYVTASVDGSCTGPAAHIYIPAESSAHPVVTLSSSSATPDVVNEGDVVTFVASVIFGPATSYEWSYSDGTEISGGGTGYPFAVVSFDDAGEASVSVRVTNACGVATATQNMTVTNACPDPDAGTVVPSSSQSVGATAGSPFTLGPVSVNLGGAQTAYQWYCSEDAIVSADDTKLIDSTANTQMLVTQEDDAGIYFYYCKMSNAACSTGASVTTAMYTVTVTEIPTTVGTGSFTGKTCFDVAMTNEGGSCGMLDNRLSQKTNFSGDYTQTYTFKTNGAVSRLRFRYVNPDTEVITGVDYDEDWETASGLNGEYTVTVHFNPGLNVLASGKSRENALKAMLYAVYISGGTDVYLKLDISVRDCACCPGYLA
jgi:hypothetical protein